MKKTKTKKCVNAFFNPFTILVGVWVLYLIILGVKSIIKLFINTRLLIN